MAKNIGEQPREEDDGLTDGERKIMETGPDWLKKGLMDKKEKDKKFEERVAEGLAYTTNHLTEVMTTQIGLGKSQKEIEDIIDLWNDFLNRANMRISNEASGSGDGRAKIKSALEAGVDILKIK